MASRMTSDYNCSCALESVSVSSLEAPANKEQRTANQIVMASSVSRSSDVNLAWKKCCRKNEENNINCTAILFDVAKLKEISLVSAKHKLIEWYIPWRTSLGNTATTNQYL